MTKLGELLDTVIMTTNPQAHSFQSKKRRNICSHSARFHRQWKISRMQAAYYHFNAQFGLSLMQVLGAVIGGV